MAPHLTRAWSTYKDIRICSFYYHIHTCTPTCTHAHAHPHACTCTPTHTHTHAHTHTQHPHYTHTHHKHMHYRQKGWQNKKNENNRSACKREEAGFQVWLQRAEWRRMHKTTPPYLHTNPHVGADLGHTGNRISRTALADGRLQSARGKIVDAETSVLSVPAGRLPHPDVVSSRDGHGPVGLRTAQRGRGDCCVHQTRTLSCASKRTLT